MAQVNDLVHRMLAAATDAPEPLAVEAYITAAREFFTNTALWRADIQGFSQSVGDSGNYSVSTGSDDEEVFDLTFLQNGRTRLLRSNLERVYRERSGSGSPRYYAVKIGGVVSFAPTGVTTSELTAIGVVRPSIGALDIDDDIAATYHTAIEQGAMAYLFLLPNQSWTAPETGQLYRQTFLAAMDDYLSRAVHSGTDDVPRRAPIVTRGG